MKYLYVLTSDTTDYYLEQAFMSIASLREHTPNGIVSLLVDDITDKNFVESRRDILDMIDELKIVALPEEIGKMQRSRWLKTAMRKHINGDFLYIDCDTIISGDLSAIDGLKVELGAVPDAHTIFNGEYGSRPYVLSVMKRIGFAFSPEPIYHFNGGLILSRDTPFSHSFFDEWHRLWQISKSKGISTDMPSLNQANINYNQCIQAIDGIWNCQIMNGGLRYLTDAKIIHYFSSNKQENPYLLGNDIVFENIRKSGITKDMLDKITNPKTLFAPHVMLVTDRAILEFISTFTFLFNQRRILKALCRFINGLYRLKNVIIGISNHLKFIAKR
jgi:lipopolysaccharide biosynthesis glycosyltransferase